MRHTTPTLAVLALALTGVNCAPPGEAAPRTAGAVMHADHAALADTGAGKHNCTVPITAEDSLKFLSKQLAVTGAVETPLVLTVDSLKKMNVATITDFTVVCQSGANMKQDSTAKGVLLRDILEKAKIKQSGHKDRNFYIVARATDGYKATFSWAELFNNPTGDNVYVLIEENGRPIVRQGDMILICRNDIKTGPRHVYWLNSIEVHRVE
ncbi:MAG: molybdopterin-dependent oxidoreductase [Flavobacteriales bacterium]|nr:molybdopterin-dependent oxidoreductase [Flavobacteriales bacterium]